MIFSSYLSFLLSFVAVGSAYDFTVKRTTQPQSLASRATPYLQIAVDQAETSFDLDSVHDLIYIANITVGGTVYPVQLDTGSSDLFIRGDSSPLPGVQNTGVSHNLSYAIGWAFGNVAYAPVEFIGNKVPSQVLLDATNVRNPALTYGAAGIAGLGFSRLSSLLNRTNSSTGQSLLYNLFAANQSTPNFIAFALQRETQPGDDVQGTFSIGEVDPKYAQVVASNHIPTWPIRNPSRWNVLVDAVIANGSIIVPKSRVVGAPSNKAVTLMDSGTSYSYAPKGVCDAIYSGVPGASFDPTLGYWSVPCGTEINMALQIAGEIFPIHPLDVNPVSTLDRTTCIGSFVPQQFSIGNDFDWIVGDNFLRSVYSMYDFGDFDSQGVMGDPYMKLLSIVDADEASVEFHRLRGGTPKTNITFSGLDGASVAPSFSISNDISESLELIGKFIPAMLGIVALNALVVIVCCIVWLVSFCRKRRHKNAMVRTPRRRLSPMPVNHRNSYIAGVEPSAINSHTYEPVSMALTDDTFVPPSPAFHRFDKKGKVDNFGRPHSLSSPQPYEPMSPGPDDSFSPDPSTEHTAYNNTSDSVEDRGSVAGFILDANSFKNEGISLRDEGVSVRDDRISVKDERLSARDVSLRDERVSLRNERISPRPSMDPLTQEAVPAGDASFVRSSMHSHIYGRSSTPADGAIRSSPIPYIQEPITAPAEAAFAPPTGLAVPYPQSVPSQINGGNFPPSTKFYQPNGHTISRPSAAGLYMQDALPPPNPGYLQPHHRSSQVYETNRGVEMGDRPKSMA